MKIVYLVSRYPSLSETFIAREMAQLAQLGHQLIICRLKWHMPWKREPGITLPSAQIVGSQFGLGQWLIGLIWAFQQRPQAIRAILQEFIQTECDLKSRLKMVTILFTCCGYARHLATENIDHIRAHFLHSESLGAMWLGQLLQVPYSVTLQTTIFYFPEAWVQKILDRATFRVATTTETERFSVDRTSANQLTYLIRSGLNLAEFRPVTLSRKVEPYPPKVLCVARLVEKKGIDLLVEACAKLRDRGVDYHCDIIGQGPEFAALTDLIHKFGLEAQVTLLGALPFAAVQEYYHTATVMVLPCRNAKDDRDGLPNVLIEALAYGIPVIATDFAGIPDLIIDGKTGLLIPVENVNALTDAVTEMLSDKSLQMQVSHLGRKKIEAEYDLAKAGIQLAEAIQKSTKVSL